MVVLNRISKFWAAAGLAHNYHSTYPAFKKGILRYSISLCRLSKLPNDQRHCLRFADRLL